MSDVKIDRFDGLLKDDGPAAVVLGRNLRSVEGEAAWIFPPTFAPSESAEEEDEGNGGNGGVYQIDELPNDPDRRNVCLIDSIGSQANRIEPMFKQSPYSALVPQIKIQMKDGDEVNLLDAGHRAADAVVRFSKVYGPKLSEAFKKYRSTRDCGELVKLAPTSLIFGVWDSRATGAKVQRIVRSIIRAYNVTKAKRSATYQAAYDYTGTQVIDPEIDKGRGKENPLSQEGFKFSLATATHGGVLVKGGIQQQAIINLVALRTLTGDLPTKRYLLGLALVALSYRDQNGFNLREGCLLCAVSKEDLDGAWKLVHFDGTEEKGILEGLTHADAIAFARETVKESSGGFKVSLADPDTFDKETAQKWLSIEKKKRKALAKTKHPAAAIAEEAATGAKKKAKESAPSEQA